MKLQFFNIMHWFFMALNMFQFIYHTMNGSLNWIHIVGAIIAGYMVHQRITYSILHELDENIIQFFKFKRK